MRINNIRNIRYEEALHSIEKMSALLIRQFEWLVWMLEQEEKQEILERMLNNENEINNRDTESSSILSMLMILLVPKASLFRKILSSFQIIIRVEHIGNLLIDIARMLQTCQIHLPDYLYFRTTLKKMLLILLSTFHSVMCAFIKENKEEIYRVLQSESDIKQLQTELSTHLVSAFQDFPMTENDIRTILLIHEMTYLLKKMEEYVLNIGRSAIYAIEGVDIRHKQKNTH
ncbi:hypothetical protein FACS189413_01290 [Bacteroidia bacterium]|nr:hypothetical protein FACS189413_01290 [Bacteroidia bacterium]